jgi:hypothetical protein
MREIDRAGQRFEQPADELDPATAPAQDTDDPRQIRSLPT